MGQTDGGRVPTPPARVETERHVRAEATRDRPLARGVSLVGRLAVTHPDAVDRLRAALDDHVVD
ncbi:MAG: hypothetical protein ABEJ34_06345 [Haloferacaceae archaeon]